MIEEASPHLLEHTNDIWQRACLRDFSELRKAQQDGTLEAPPSWRDLYLTKQQQTEEAKALATARIKGRYAEHSAQKDAKKLVVSNVPIPTHRRARRPAPSRPSTPIRVQGTIHAAQGTHRPRDADAPDDAPPRLAPAAPRTSLVSSIAIT